MKIEKTTRLVRYEHLNHHDTLFAGRLSEWFVESCFISAAKATGKPESLVCLEILDFIVRKPAKGGDLIDFRSFVARTGKSSLIVYCSVTGMDGSTTAEGFITFVCLDDDGRPSPHGISLDDPISPEESAIRLRADRMFRSSLEGR
ncbi:acyl-CoA thioesterase [Youngiibacter multivorans]|uniref:Acyl-CoA hydrolase n=1 Tax=Youngiibacter multivorans TaxID=937251 RepID=A0ABS4G818_9CLOT|nr:acyl-CoA thioesterase [Youngiibacter multivorans]MBP1920681.1 acyl-CoA hydrolase [Youngiibacter multivorans]